MAHQRTKLGVILEQVHSSIVTEKTKGQFPYKAKIYTLCCKMGFQYPKDELSTEDNITLRIVESYLDFKAGEVWNEVAGELAQEGLRPVSSDQECLQDIMHTHEEKAEETLKLQHDLIEEQQEDDLDKERQFYEKIKLYHHLEEKEK